MIINHIYYINARFKYKKKVYNLDGIVYKHNADQLYNRVRILKKLKVNAPVTLYDITVLKELGKSIA